MSTSIRFSIDAPGSGQRGSVHWESATGSSHWKPRWTNSEVKFFRVCVITFPMADFLSISVSESCSRVFGSSPDVEASMMGVCLVCKIIHFGVYCFCLSDSLGL